MPKPRYWSTEYIEAFVEAINENTAFQKTASSFSDIIILRCYDTPDGQDIEAAYTFEDGEIVDVDLWLDEAPSAELRDEPFDKSIALARATATYELWAKLDRGEMSVLQALASPEYEIEGSKLKIMSNIGIFNGMNEVAASVDKTY